MVEQATGFGQLLLSRAPRRVRAAGVAECLLEFTDAVTEPALGVPHLFHVIVGLTVALPRHDLAVQLASGRVEVAFSEVFLEPVGRGPLLGRRHRRDRGITGGLLGDRRDRRARDAGTSQDSRDAPC